MAKSLGIGLRLIAFTAFSAALLFFQMPAPSADANEIGSQGNEELNNSMDYREMMGLKHDANYVEEVNAKKEVPESKEKYGVWLTPEELAELEERLSEQEVIPEILDYISEQGLEDKFGGLTVDQEAKGIVTINFTDHSSAMLDKHIEEIKKIFKNDDKIIFKKVKYSEKELNQLHEKIRNDQENLSKTNNITIAYMSTDTTQNKIEIAVAEYNKNTISELKNIYGDDIIVVDGSGLESVDESRTSNTRPLKGGLRIKNTTDGSNCTGGFNAVMGDWVYYVTAGHCGKSSSSYMQGGYFIGSTARWQNSGSIDAAVMTLGQLAWGKSNKNYGQSNFTSYAKESQEYVGRHVCMNGSYTGNACGKITSTNVSNTNHHNLSGANYASQNGDSGAPIHYSGKVFGIHKGYIGKHKVYTQVEQIIKKWGVYPRTWG